MTTYNAQNIPYEFDLWYDVKTALGIIEELKECEAAIKRKEHILQLVATYNLNMDELITQAIIEKQAREESYERAIAALVDLREPESA